MKGFLESFNTLALIIYLICMLIFISVTNNPVVQAVFFVSICLLIMLADKKAFKNALILAVFIGIPIILINPIVNSRGITVLFRMSEIPVLGDIKITLEALVFALMLMFKLINTVFLFVFFNLCVEPDRFFNLMAVVAPRSAMTATLTAKMVPSMIESTKRIAEVQMTRGVQLDSKSLLKRISNGWPFIKILLFSSLEGSLQTAEALESKGYGYRKRSSYYKEGFKLKDLLIVISGAVAILLIILKSPRNFLDFKFFPRIGVVSNEGICGYIVILILPILVVLPAMLGWRFNKCRFIRRKI